MTGEHHVSFQGHGLRLGRSESEEEIAARFRPLLPSEVVRVSGTDSWTLQRLVTIACRESLEIRDPRGDLLRGVERLVNAHGSRRHGKRIRQRWIVDVTTPTVAVPDGYAYLVETWGTDTNGRRAVFTSTATVHLWEHDLA